MTDQEFEQSLKISYYKEIATLNEAHNIIMVQHTENARTYVKKTLSLYNKDVYHKLMEHPVVGVPRIFEVFETDGKLIVIEEYISGINLETLLEEKGRLSEEQTRSYAIKLCDILSKLHSMIPPIIHRDIKPSNIILADDGRLVLVDLNGAKQADPEKNKDTTLIGTQGYAAPEQYGFGPSNVQTDLYAVGKLMTCLLTGNPEVFPECSKDLKRIIDKCTQIETNKRYSSALQLKNALTKRSQITKQTLILYTAIACSLAIIALLIILIINIRQSNDNNSDLSGTLSPTSGVMIDNADISKSNTSSIEASDISSTPADADSLNSDPTNTPEPYNKASVTPDVSDNVTVTATPDVSDSIDFSSPIGVYEGNDREKLVIADNGFAYYYCVSEEFTEVECPWSMTDDEITINLSVLHCDITAKTKSGFEELIFKSRSLNWNSEVFTKISNDAASAILDPPPSPVKYISLSHSGEKHFVLDKIAFTIAKQFYVGSPEDFGASQMGRNSFWNSADYEEDSFVCFMDMDLGESFSDEAFVSSIFFFPLSGIDVDEALSDPKATVIEKANFFLDKLQVNYTDTVEIAGRSCPLVCVNGLLNTGFMGISDYVMTGYVVFLPVKNNTSLVGIQMLQRAGMKQDNSECFMDTLKQAVPVT